MWKPRLDKQRTANALNTDRIIYGYASGFFRRIQEKKKITDTLVFGLCVCVSVHLCTCLPAL